mmetsp:Transcript_29129/g.86495  ORF Transcript_29129/g.86495 Transcript_29129/m.86495 type:complete len:200 (+) Transcript_29129:93-692(+)
MAALMSRLWLLPVSELATLTDSSLAGSAAGASSSPLAVRKLCSWPVARGESESPASSSASSATFFGAVKNTSTMPAWPGSSETTLTFDASEWVALATAWENCCSKFAGRGPLTLRLLRTTCSPCSFFSSAWSLVSRLFIFLERLWPLAVVFCVAGVGLAWDTRFSTALGAVFLAEAAGAAAVTFLSSPSWCLWWWCLWW